MYRSLASGMPPLTLQDGLARVCFLTLLMFSTTTSSCQEKPEDAPSLAAVAAVWTILDRSCECSIRASEPPDLQNFGCQRDDFHEPALAEFPPLGPKTPY